MKKLITFFKLCAILALAAGFWYSLYFAHAFYVDWQGQKMVNQLLKEHRGEYYVIEQYHSRVDKPIYYFRCRHGIPYTFDPNGYERMEYFYGRPPQCLGGEMESLGQRKDLKVRSRLFFTKRKFLFANFYEYQMTDENHIVNSINKELNL